MESGHSMMEVDSMHSSIENAKRNIPIYAVQDWLIFFKLQDQHEIEINLNLRMK